MGFEVRAIRDEEREECLTLWRTVWSGDNDAYFRKYFYGDVEWLPYYTQVGALDGKIVTSVQICKRVVACGEFRLTMGGVANVATLPEHRNAGYNTACLEAAVRVMEADAMDFSLLFTGIHDYYARLGYAKTPLPARTGTLRADLTPIQTKCAVRPATGADLPAIRQVYAAYNQRRPIAVQRYEAYWREWLGMTPERMPDGLLVAEDGAGRVCGYVRPGAFLSAIPYNPEEVEMRVIELGVAADSEAEERALTQTLLEGVAAQFLAQGIQKIRLDLAFTPAVESALPSILATQETAVVGYGMMRVLHRTNLLQSLILEFQERWIEAGRPSGSVGFETPYGAVALEATGTFLRVEPTEANSELLPQEALFGLLFGTVSPPQATPNAALYPLLTALFPPQYPVYWGADGF